MALVDTVKRLAKENPAATICWEYNGYNYDLTYHDYGKNPQAITTMPKEVPWIVKHLRTTHIPVWAISYNSAVTGWQQAAELLKGKYVSMNFLLEPGWIFPIELIKYCHQVNLLSFKPDGRYQGRELLNIKMLIELLKPRVKVATDNCLAVQLSTAKSCGRGTEFVHVMSDGTTQDCSFQSWCYLHPATGGSSEPSKEGQARK